MSSKTYKRYPAKDALKKGSASTIESACTKIIISSAFVELRQKYNTLKNEYQKSQVKLEQMDQLKKDNDSKLIQLTKKNDVIKQHHITIAQLNNDIKLLKETSVDRGDANRLEGFIKKKEQIIKELEKQIDNTKLNHLYHLENTIHKQNEQIKHLKEVETNLTNEKNEYKKKLHYLSDKEDKLTNDYFGFIKKNDSLKEEIEQLKKVYEENEALIKKLDEYKRISTQLFDLG